MKKKLTFLKFTLIIIFAAFTVQFFIVGEKTAGAVFLILTLCCFKIKRTYRDVANMSGVEFEHYCAEVLIDRGFRKVKVTPPSGDYGADLIAEDRKGNIWVFQCKHFTGKVGNSAVQQAVAAKAHYGAECAGVITNSQLTVKARQLADENDVVIYENID